MNRTAVSCAAVLAAFIAVPSYGYGAPVTIEELIGNSDVIVVAHVVAVRVSGSGEQREKIATAKISAVWKGYLEVGTRIDYVASPGWYLCDTSNAKVGETIVLFLEKDKSVGRYHLAHFGRGRMPIIGESKRRQVQTDEVIFDSVQSLIEGLRPPWTNVVALDVLEGVVSRHTSR